MRFCEQLNIYMEALDCTARELSEAAGLSPATLSRYRAGERVPEADSEAFERLCAAVAALAAAKGEAALTREAVAAAFGACEDVVLTDREQLRQRFNTLLSVLDVSVAGLCRYTNYDASTISRFRNGTRQPSDPASFAAGAAGYLAEETANEASQAVLAELFGCAAAELTDEVARRERIAHWLLAGQNRRPDSMATFLSKLDEFDLNAYIKAIRFDELRVPSLPFQLPTSKSYRGLREMMDSELDFLKATVLSRSTAPVIMYSDMPMEEMARDETFPKKWMYGMALMLKKGLHLHQIHHLDRSFQDMMLGLESWIPMYMTGQISPYYFKDGANGAFRHLLKVSGAAALAGEAIAGHHADGRYYLTKSREELAYYTTRAEEMLATARPLMDIYRAERAGDLRAFWRAEARTAGEWRQVLSAPPLYAMGEETLTSLLRTRGASQAESGRILAYAAEERQLVAAIGEQGTITVELPQLTREEFDRAPLSLPLAGLFYESDIAYTYEAYTAHLRETEAYVAAHPYIRLRRTSTCAFRNLQIFLRLGQWAMVSKSRSPAIHFVIRHPKLRQALEQFVPPVVEV